MNKEEKIIKILESEGIPNYDGLDIARLVNHVDVHEYFLGKNFKISVTWDDALFSWYENVFLDIVKNSKRSLLNRFFPDRSWIDLFFVISDHWYFMSKQNEEFNQSALFAVKNYTKVYSKINIIFKFVLSLFI